MLDTWPPASTACRWENTTPRPLGSVTSFAPFAYLFHVVLSCIFFTRKESFRVVLLASVLFIGCVVVEKLGLVPPAGIFTGATCRSWPLLTSRSIWTCSVRESATSWPKAEAWPSVLVPPPFLLRSAGRGHVRTGLGRALDQADAGEMPDQRGAGSATGQERAQPIGPGKELAHEDDQVVPASRRWNELAVSPNDGA